MNDQIGPLGLLYKFKDSERLALCQKIAEACEQAFRRGFAQGVETGRDAVVDLEHWRFGVSLSESPSPHGTYNSDALSRHAFPAGLPTQMIHVES